MQPSSKPERLLAMAFDAMGTAIERIQKSIDEVTAQLDAKYSSQKASHLAYLAEKLGGIMRELRLHEKHEQGMSGAMNPDEEFAGLLEYLRDLPADRRAVLREHLVEIDGEATLLGHDTPSRN